MSTIDEVTEIKKLYACPEPCNGWCGIYSEKLDTDPLFPFSIHTDREIDVVKIIPCDIGVTVGLDYTGYIAEYIFNFSCQDARSEDVMRNFSVGMMRIAMEIYQNKENPKTYKEQDRNIIELCTFFVAVRCLKNFKKYVITTPEDVRKQRRDEIAAFIENHLTDSVSDQEIFDFMNQLPSEISPSNQR